MRKPNSSNNRALRMFRHAAAITALALAAACAAAQNYSLNVLSQFPSGTAPLGSSPLVRDAAGNLYGMTGNGTGALGVGSIYEFVNNNGSFSFTTLYSFTGGSDGANPNAGLSMDGAGNLYGAAQSGGANGKGTVFELQNVNGAFNFVLLHTFIGSPSDGANPNSTLPIDSAGNLYGTAGSGGSGPGTVFELANNGAGGFLYILLHSFTGLDGANPNMIAIGPNNMLYGICKFGGPGFVPGVPQTGLGTVYALSIAPIGAANDIYQFTSISAGTPIGPPTVDARGNVYVAMNGASASGVTLSGGSVIELVNTSNGYVEKTLYSFPLPNNNPGGDASGPNSSLILDAYGNIFGTTGLGGAYGEEASPPGGYGTLYELVNNAGSYQEGVLFSAPGDGNGIRPGELLMDQSGNFYGAFGHTSFTVGVGGQGNAEVWQLAVQPATTELALSASPNPAFYGDDVTLTAAVTANPAGVFLPGTVTFSEGSTILGTGFSVNGPVSITIESNQLGAGADPITARFTPSTLGVTGSSASIVENVNASSDIAVLSGSNTFNGNQTVNGVIAAGNFIGGTFTGDGAGLSNVTAANFTGTILDSQVSGLTLDLASAEAAAVAQAESSLNGAFVPLAGGTMTGSLTLPVLSAGTASAINPGDIAASGNIAGNSLTTSQILVPHGDPANNLNIVGDMGINGTIPGGSINLIGGYGTGNGGNVTITGGPGGICSFCGVSQGGSIILTPGQGGYSPGDTGTPGTIQLNGLTNVNGNLSATSFTGNGSGLTGVSAFSATTITGNIGDSQVTGLATDLANSTAAAVSQAASNASAVFVPLAGGTMTGALNLPSVNATGAVASGSLTIGGGAAITQYVSVTDSVTLPAIKAGQCTTFTTAALAGFTPGAIDSLALGIPSMLLSGLTNSPAPPPGPGPAPPPPPPGPAVFLTYQAWETSTSTSPTITLQVCNPSTSYNGGASGTIRIDIFKH